MGAVSGGPILVRIKPSELEQKFRVPVLVLTGVASATYCAHCPCKHAAVMWKRKPDFSHHALAQPRVLSIKPACSALLSPGAVPSVPKLAANPLSGYVDASVICGTFSVRKFPTADASFAAVRERSKLGMAIAAAAITNPASM